MSLDLSRDSSYNHRLPGSLSQVYSVTSPGYPEVPSATVGADSMEWANPVQQDTPEGWLLDSPAHSVLQLFVTVIRSSANRGAKTFFSAHKGSGLCSWSGGPGTQASGGTVCHSRSLWWRRT